MLGLFLRRLCYEYTKHLEVQIPFPPLRMLLFRYERCVPGILYILSRWTGIWKEIWDFDEFLHFSVAYGYNDTKGLAMSSTFCDEYQSFRYRRREDCNGIVACTRRIANNDQLRTVIFPRLSKFIASEMCIRDANKFLCTLEIICLQLVLFSC